MSESTKPILDDVKFPPVLSRPSFRQIYMELAHSMARRSTCRRLQVGCVITTTDFRKVISVGYNGSATGLPNDCASTEPGACQHIHAEANAVINCDTPRYVEKVVFVSMLPCAQCMRFLVNLGGVQQVFYAEDYRVRDSIDIASMANIRIDKLAYEPVTGPPLVFKPSQT